MSEPFHIEHAGEPAGLVFGPPTGAHIVATLRPVGCITVQAVRDYDCDGEQSWPVVTHEIIEEDWKEHPEEAAADYELRYGDKRLALFSFPSLNEPCAAEAEAQNDANWGAIWHFADEHKIDMRYIGRAFTRHMLDKHLDQEAHWDRRNRERAIPLPGTPACRLNFAQGEPISM